LENELAAFYDQEAQQRATRPLAPHRLQMREAFATQLICEGRHRLIEIGTGPGLDAAAFLARGLEVSGVDLSVEHVRLCRQAGIDAQQASVQQLPYADDAFDAGWTMSTLLHVPDSEFDQAVREIRRVLAPGSPLAIGLWGGADSEGVRHDDEIHPPRFFSFRADSRLQQMLSQHGTVEQFETWTPDGPGRRTYQWAVLRTA